MNPESTSKHIFIIGSKGIPAQYGGFETFTEKLTALRKDERICYHVACMSDRNEDFVYNNAQCFRIKVPNIGPAKAVYYDIKAIDYCCKYIEKNQIKGAVVYVLACRIGPFIGRYKRRLAKSSCRLYVNPDGHEWKRAKWNALIKRYWKFSERLMVKHADLLICDSKNIEKYIKQTYARFNPNTMYLSYGSETKKSALPENDPKLQNWYEKFGISKGQYYLIVGRFVPENNYETMIREYMKSKTEKDLVIITGFEGNKYYGKLKDLTNFDSDPRIKFVGTVYDQELLKKIRENAYGYLHGHEVGGTNPSLLEALGSTDLNLLLDVGFNREVGEDGALYWTKEEGCLARLIEKADGLSRDERDRLGTLARKRINDCYSWDKIVGEYESLFISGNKTSD